MLVCNDHKGGTEVQLTEQLPHSARDLRRCGHGGPASILHLQILKIIIILKSRSMDCFAGYRYTEYELILSLLLPATLILKPALSL